MDGCLPDPDKKYPFGPTVRRISHSLILYIYISVCVCVWCVCVDNIMLRTIF